MPIFEVQGPDGRKFRVNTPEGATSDQAIDYIMDTEYAKPSILDEINKPAVRKPEESFLRPVADVGLQIQRGAVQGVRMLADAFGAGSETAKTLMSVDDHLAKLLSAQAQQDQQEISRLMKEAEDKGIGAQVAAGLKAFAVAPVDTLAQAFGTAIPTLAGGLTGAALRLGAVGTAAVGSGIGAGMGAGVVKGTIYEAVKDALTERGESPEVAEQKAQEAQSYGGENWGSILTGTVLGGVAGQAGIERALVGRFAAKQAAKEAAEQTGAEAAKAAARPGIIRTAVGEALPEAAQAGQEQLAENIALQKQGFDVPTFRGVAGAATFEGVAGAGLGAGVGALGRAAPKAPALKPTTTEEEGQADKELASLFGEDVEAEEETEEVEAPKKKGAKEPLRPDVLQEMGDLIAKLNTGEETFNEKDERKLLLNYVSRLGLDAGDYKKFKKPEELRNELSKLLVTPEGKMPDEAAKPSDTGAGFGVPSTPPTGTTPGAGEAGPGGLGAGSVDTGTAGVGTGAGESTLGGDVPLGGEAPPPKKVSPLNGKRKKLQGTKLPMASVTSKLLTPDELDYINEYEKIIASGRIDELDPEDIAYANELRSRIETGLANQKSEQLEKKIAEDEYVQIENLYNKAAEQASEELKVRGLPSQFRRREGATGGTLTEDERQVYMDALGSSRSAESATEALAALSDYRDSKSAYAKNAGIRADLRTDSIAAYEINRKAESKARGVEFPAWTDLTKKEQEAYLEQVPFKPKEARIPGPAGGVIKSGFDAVTPLVAERQTEVQEKQRQKEERTAAENYAAAQRRIEDEQLGLTGVLPSNIVEDIKLGDSQSAIRYLAESARGASPEVTAEGIERLERAIDEANAEASREAALYEEQTQEREKLKADIETATGKTKKELQSRLDELVSDEDYRDAQERIQGSKRKLEDVLRKARSKVDPLTAQVNRLIASVINGLKINTKIVYDPDFDGIAEYNPATDTIRVSDRGLNETALMHEFVHAATINVLNKFQRGKRNELSADQQRGAQQIIRLFNLVKDRPGMKSRFPRAFDNVYEFVSYGLTDPKFQLELQKINLRQRATIVKGEDDQRIAVEHDVIYTNYFADEESVRVEEAATGKKVDVTKTAWQSFVHSVAQAIGLFNRFGKTLKNTFTPREYFDQIRKKSEKEIVEDLKTAEDQEGFQEFLDAVADGFEQKETDIFQRLDKAQREYEAQQTYFERDKSDKQKAKLDRAKAKVERIEAEIESGVGFGVKETKGEKKRRLSASVEPGYLGNLFLELVGAFSDIAAAPEPIQGFTTSLPMAAKKPPKKTDESLGKFVDEQVQRLDDQNPSNFQKASIVKRLFTKEGVTKTVETLQNYRFRLEKLQDLLYKSGKLFSSGDKQNNIGTAVTTSAGIAENTYQKEFYTLIDDAQNLLKELTDITGESAKKTLARLHAYAIYLHDPERRRVKFLREAPLTNIKAVQDREKIISDVLKAPDKATAEKLRSDLEALVTANLDSASSLADIKNPAYNTLGPHSYKRINEQFAKAFTGESKKKADELIKKLRSIEDATIRLNKESNYFSPQVQNLVWFYGFKNYFPFKGKPDSGPRDYQLDPHSQQLSGELQDKQEAFDGRITDSDNPILNVINEASRSAMRVGRHRAGVTKTLKNLLREAKKDYKEEGPGIQGKVLKTIKFEDRFDADLEEGLKRGVKNIFHYNPDGTVDILQIEDPNMLQAIKKPIQADNFILDKLGKATSLFGQMHTRYNPAFAPVDFLRNLFTYAGIVGAELGPKRGLQIMGEMARVLAMGGFHQTGVFSMAYANGNKPRMAALAKQNSFYKDLNEYYDKGGRTAYLQGISYKENLIDAINSADGNGVLRSLSGVQKYFDAWLDMFEISTRVAAYRTMKAQYMAEGMNADDAATEAVAFTKNLANFEKTGFKGKEIGSLFMFFRPAATGAVRSFEALLPALDVLKTDAQLLEKIKKQNKDVKGFTEADAKKVLVKQKERAKNAAVVTTALMGVGFATYAMSVLMAGEDDEDRNKTVTDDPARWVRFARFNTGMQSGGQDLVLQMPWGFGFGAFASIGAQLAAFGFGAQPFGKMVNNVIDAGAESFVPLPISKINKFEHPVQATLDTLLPSAARPMFEWAMNMDGLGRAIYNNRQSRNNDAYTGGDNIPEIYKSAARFLYDATEGAVDWSPNTLYFFSNNYFDGMARLGAFTYNVANVATGEKNFDFKTDTLLLDAYLKAPSNYDARQFAEVEKEIRSIDQKLRAFKLPGREEKYFNYIDNNPEAEFVVSAYNQFNGQLNGIREAANRARKDTTMSIKERQDLVRMYVKQQDMLKAMFTSQMEMYGIEPD
jgi:hypothetical protein